MHALELAGDQVAVHGVEQLVLAGEVVVETALRHARTGDHLRHTGRVVPVVGKQVDGGSEDALAYAGLAACPGRGHEMRSFTSIAASTAAYGAAPTRTRAVCRRRPRRRRATGWPDRARRTPLAGRPP